MSAARIEAWPYALPLAKPYLWAGGAQRVRRGLLVRWTRADGTVGWGEAAPPPNEAVDLQAWAALARQAGRVGPAVAPGPLGPAGLARPVRPRLSDALPPRLRHAVLGAWLDAQARAEGHALGPALGAAARRPAAAQVPANVLVEARPPAAAARAAAGLAARGYTTFKVKCTGDAEADVARAAAVREAVGPRAGLRLDANGSWARRGVAERAMRQAADLGVEYAEQPVPPAQRARLRALARDGGVAVALDESAASPAALGICSGLEDRFVAILKPQRLGGADRCVEMMQVAEAAGVRCVVTNSLETAIGRAHALHLASLLPAPLAPCGLATGGFFAQDVASLPDAPKMAVRGPGLGVAVPAVAAVTAAAWPWSAA